MELKDVILSTIAELEEQTLHEQESDLHTSDHYEVNDASQTSQVDNTTNTDTERYFLESIRERLLVLFEGFQAPNNTNLEAKIDMTLNFLEFTLATIDARIENLDKGTHS